MCIDLPCYDEGIVLKVHLPYRILQIEYIYLQAEANSFQTPLHQWDSSSFLKSVLTDFLLVESVSRSCRLWPFPKVLVYDPSAVKSTVTAWCFFILTLIVF